MPVIIMASSLGDQATTPSSSNFWSGRREWWRAEEVRGGTDWVGIAATIIEVDAFLRGRSP
jgi:hypothetical protein